VKPHKEDADEKAPDLEIKHLSYLLAQIWPLCIASMRLRLHKSVQ